MPAHQIFGLLPTPTLTANPIVFPGAREGDAGKTRMIVSLEFDTADEAKEWLLQNKLPTVIFDRK